MMGCYWQRIYPLLLGAALLTVAQVDIPILEIKPAGALLYKALGDNLFLTCIAKGDSTNLITDLKWLGPDGNEIPKTPRKYTEKTSDDRSMLFIKKIQEEDAGEYQCTAAFAGQTDPLSIQVSLETFMDITWEDAPEEQHVVVDTNSKIKCGVRANPHPTVDWLKDGLPFKATDRCIVEHDGILCSPVLQPDEGQYTCRARVATTGRILERIIRVEVDTVPKIDSLQSEYKAIEEEVITMTCSATGKPIPTISWKNKDNADLSKKDGYVVDARLGHLIIQKVSRDDHGEFICLAKNLAGEDEAQTRLSVVSKPKIKVFKTSNAIKHNTTQLICTVFADPLAEIVIKKKDSQRVFKDHLPYDDRIITDLTQEKMDQTLTLTIKEVNDNDGGLYECEAKNIGGIASAQAHIIVQHPPEFDVDVTMPVKSWENNVVNLTCIARSIPNATIEWYNLDWDISNDPNIHVYGNGPISILQVKTTGNTYYREFRCKATNLLGIRELPFRIEQAFNPKEIKQADFKTVTATTVTFLIIGPDDNGGMPLTHYVVEYKKDGEDELKYRSWPVADNSYILNKLEPEKRYTFKFSAMNQVGSGFYAQPLHMIMPKKGAPEEPQIIVNNPGKSIISPYSDRVTIRWNLPEDNGEKIDSFQITYKPLIDGEPSDKNGGTLNEGPASTQVELKNLYPSTTYKVEVRAHNLIGYSVPGQVEVRTAHGTQTDHQQLQTAGMQLEIIVGIVVAIFVAILILIDVSCYFTNHCGVLMCLCVHVCGKEPPREKEKDGIMDSGKNSNKEKEALKDPLDNDYRGKSPHGSRSSIAKDSPV